MAVKSNQEGFFVSNRIIGLIILAVIGGGGAIGFGGFTLSRDATTKDIQQTIQSVIKSESMLTPEEAVIWADEREIQNSRQKHIDGTLVKHTEDIAELKEDIYVVQQTATANQAILRDIAKTVGVVP